MESVTYLAEGTTPTQAAIQLRPGLNAYAGINEPLARMVSDYTGEVFQREIRTFALSDDDGSTFVAVLHTPEIITRMGQPEARLWISIMPGGLPFTRDTVIILATTIFDEMGAAELAIRVRFGDIATRHALGRLGFRNIGRKSWRDGDRTVFALRPENFPTWYRQWRARRSRVN